MRRVLARKKVGDLEIEDETEYFTPTNIGLATGSRFPTQVQEYIRCYVEGFSMGATVVGAASIIDRGAQTDLGVPYLALVRHHIPTFDPDQCPLCQQGQPIVKPGSRSA